MAETRNLNWGDDLGMLGSLGPWTVNLPPGAHGQQIGLRTRDAEPVEVTINTQPGEPIVAFDGKTYESATTTFIRESWQLVFDESNLSQWFFKSGAAANVYGQNEVDAPPISLPIGPTATPGALTEIPLVFARGDDTVITVEPDGTLRANYTIVPTFTEIHLSSALALNLATSGTNSMIQARFTFERSSGLGPFKQRPDSKVLSHSRAMDAEYRVAPSAIWQPQAGDIVRLVGQVVDNDGGSVCDITSGMITWRVVEA